MKSMWKVCLMVGLLVMAVNANATVLFQDTYDRADDFDISANAPAGMSGTLASTMTYSEDFQGSGAESIKIKENTLRMAVAAGMSSMHLNHNFTDSSIATAGGFSVSLDVLLINASGDELNRWAGFGLGMSESEAASAGDPWDSDYALRPSATPDGTFSTIVTDFYVDVAMDNKVRLWSDGVVLETIDIGDYRGTLRADFYLSDFNQGTVVTSKIYFNDDYLTTVTFDWSGTDENYIGISARANNNVNLDNLEIATIPEPATMIFLGLGGLLLRRKK